MESLVDRPKKILCLHGFFQTPSIFRQKTAALFKKLEKSGYQIDLVPAPIRLRACDLPFDLKSDDPQGPAKQPSAKQPSASQPPAQGTSDNPPPPSPPPEGLDEDFVKIPNKDQLEIALGWYITKAGVEDEPYLDPESHRPLHPKERCCEECPTTCVGPKPPPRMYNAELAMRTLRDWIEEHGPYEGLIGFSQGGCVVNSWLCGDGGSAVGEKIRWAMTCSSNVPGSDFVANSEGSDAALRFRKVNREIPVMIVCGLKDTHILKEATILFKEKWSPEAEVLIHEGGHCMPQRSEYILKILEFIKKNSAASSP